MKQTGMNLLRGDLLSGRIGLTLVLLAVTLVGCAPAPNAPSPNAAAEAEPAQPQPSVSVENVNSDAQAVAPSDDAKKDEQAAAEASHVPQESIAADEVGPQTRTVLYSADLTPAEILPVLLSKGHEAFCRVKVGDTMPTIELPQIGAGTERKKLSVLFGKKATVVVFWKSDRRMTIEQLADLGPDVVQPFGKKGVAVIGIAVNESIASAQATLRKVGTNFPNLLDAAGKAFAQVGSEKLPRTYLVDPQGKILWFDIEYSLATRRELHQALRAIVGKE